MKKLIAFVLILVCALGLFGCNNTAEIEIDKIVMLYAAVGDDTPEQVIIIDKETISELLAMYHSLEVTRITSPLADDCMWVTFYMGDEVEIEWCISAYENHWVNSEFISYSNLWDEGNHAVTNNFDFSRLVEIFDTAKG